MRNELSLSSESVSSSTVKILVAPPSPLLLRFAWNLPAVPTFAVLPVDVAPPTPMPPPFDAVKVVELSPDVADEVAWLLPAPLLPVDVANCDAAIVSRFKAADCVKSWNFLICCKKEKKKRNRNTHIKYVFAKGWRASVAYRQHRVTGAATLACCASNVPWQFKSICLLCVSFLVSSASLSFSSCCLAWTH